MFDPERPMTPAQVGQGGALVIGAAAGGGAGRYSFYTGSQATHSGSGFNASADNLWFPFVGSYDITLITASEPITDTGTTTLPVTVLPEPAGGTLATGVRIGALQGVSGCYYCDAYSDNRIMVRAAATSDGKLIAAFDQKHIAADSGDSILARVFDPDSEQFGDLLDADTNRGQGVSLLGLGEGNPQRYHQFDVAMAENGDAMVVFMQQTLTGTGAAPSNRGHVFASFYDATAETLGTPIRLDNEGDPLFGVGGASNPKVVIWREGAETHALAVWAPGRFATYDGGTGAWTASATIHYNVSNGTSSEPILVGNASGRAFLLWEDQADVFAIVFDEGAWDVPAGDIAPLYTAAVDDVQTDLAASSDGTAIVLIGHEEGTTEDPVYAIRYDGAQWQSADQIGDSADIATMAPAAWGTAYTSVSLAQIAMDASGNALAVWNAVVGAGYPVAVSSYYTAGGTFGAFKPIAGVATETDAEFVHQPPYDNIGPVRIGLALDGDRAIVTYPVSSFSLPAGSGAAQLVFRRYDVSDGAWSARTLVDTKPNHKHGHSEVRLRSDGSALAVYEVWPAYSDFAGTVYAREIGAAE